MRPPPRSARRHKRQGQLHLAHLLGRCCHKHARTCSLFINEAPLGRRCQAKCGPQRCELSFPETKPKNDREWGTGNGVTHRYLRLFLCSLALWTYCTRMPISESEEVATKLRQTSSDGTRRLTPRRSQPTSFATHHGVSGSQNHQLRLPQGTGSASAKHCTQNTNVRAYLVSHERKRAN